MAHAAGRIGRAVAGIVAGVIACGQPGGILLAQETVALRGELLVGGRYLVDPPPDDPKDSHAYVTIEGPAALRLYRSMPAREEPDRCRGRGWKLKRAGGLACAIAANGRDGACDFAVDLRAGRLAGGRPC